VSPQARIYCHLCRRSLSPRNYDLPRWEDLPFQVCQTCLTQLQTQGIMVSPEITIESESMVQISLQSREGGEREVETPSGFVDLLTDEYVIEIKHVKDWKDGAKVLIYALNFPTRKPRVHLFGGYSQNFRSLVEDTFSKLNIAVTWERDPY
jgi:hypothetical protein